MINLLKLWAKSSARVKLQGYTSVYMPPHGLCTHSAATAFQPMIPQKTVEEIQVILFDLENVYFNEALAFVNRKNNVLEQLKEITKC